MYLVWCVIWVWGVPQLGSTCNVGDIVEWYVPGHPGGYSCCEGTNLLLNVVEKCIGRPSAMFLDSDGVDSIKFHSHGAPGSKGVAADIVLGKAKLV